MLNQWQCSLHIQTPSGEWLREDECNIAKMSFHSSPLALIPPHGYAHRDNHSKEAMEWVLWFQSQYLEKIHIRHVRSGESE